MHQPYYRDTLSGRYMLPWVRLHAAKDYVHMAELVAEFPAVHLTFNYVPSLVEQLEDYANGAAVELWTEVSRREQLTDEDKRFLLEHFFSIDWERFVRPHPRYWRLLQMRNQVGDAVELLAEPFWRDLVVW